jgi:hypothetical protein
MTDLGDGWFGWPEGAPRLPLMFSVRAEKPSAQDQDRGARF